MIINDKINEAFSSPVRSIKAKAELYNGSALVKSYGSSDKLIEFTIDRIGEESKFFGFGICQKLNLKIIDASRQEQITTGNSIKVCCGTQEALLNCFPIFNVSEVHRDEKTNQLSVTAYDTLYKAADIKVEELALPEAFYVGNVVNRIAEKLKLSVKLPEALEQIKRFQVRYDTGINLSGSETLRKLLNAIAEFTGTIYFINSKNELVFKTLDFKGTRAFSIPREAQFEFKSGNNRRLAAICHATELGDNITASSTLTGTTQYIRNNPFYELREDAGALLEEQLSLLEGATIGQFDCSWRGNGLVEIGDKIELADKAGKTISSFIINDTIKYNGVFNEKTKWNYAEEEAANSNPSTLGDVLNQTSAKVDKANKEISLTIKKVEANSESLNGLWLDTDNIRASVSAALENTDNAIENVKNDIEAVRKTAETKMDAESVNIAISKELENGVDKVITSTGFKFDETGLNISKTNSNMITNINENGMVVKRDNSEVLIADNQGVKAEDLHATTYLIIGQNSRLEDLGNNKTACFWIGG